MNEAVAKTVKIHAGKTKFQILIILFIAAVCHATGAFAINLKCPQALKKISTRNFGSIFTVKNPIPAKGNEKLFPANLLIAGADGTLPEPTHEQILDLRDKILDYAHYLYKWRFITKMEYEDYVFNIQALAQLPKKVSTDLNTASQRAEKEPGLVSGNHFFPDNSPEEFKKPASEVIVDDFISVIDLSWNNTDKKIRRSPDIQVLHPYWRRAGEFSKEGFRYLGIFAVVSILWAAGNSLNISIKDQPSGEVGRSSYAARARMTLENFSPADAKTREKLMDFYVRKHGMFNWLEVESRDEYVQAQMFLMMKQDSLITALQLKNPALVKIHLQDLFEFERMFPDAVTDPLGARLNLVLKELYKTFDPDGKIRAEYDASHAEEKK